MAVKVTLVPEQIVLFVALDEMLTLAVDCKETVVAVEEVAATAEHPLVAFE